MKRNYLTFCRSHASLCEFNDIRIIKEQMYTRLRYYIIVRRFQLRYFLRKWNFLQQKREREGLETIVFFSFKYAEFLPEIRFINYDFNNFSRNRTKERKCFILERKTKCVYNGNIADDNLSRETSYSLIYDLH